MPMSCCGLDFVHWEALQSHIRSHAAHEECRRCRKGFMAVGPFKQHIRMSQFHNQSQPLLPQGATIHTYEVSNSSENPVIAQVLPVNTSSATKAYSGIPASVIKPVFKAACRLRFSKPEVGDLVRVTSTKLDERIVSAILEGALRLLPTDNSPESQIARKLKEATKAAQALEAGKQFISWVQSFQPQSMREEEQRENIKSAMEAGSSEVIRSTPDVLFLTTTRFCDSDIQWLEYKNMFGFKSNPFVHKKHKAQLRRYVETFGRGMVVYKLGYECNHLVIDGLKVMREADVLHWIRSQVVF